MVSFTSALVLFTTLATTAIHVSANPSGVVHDLVARQTFDPTAVPEECQEQCSSLLDSLTETSCSTDLNCICGTEIANKTKQCARCDASVVGEEAAESLYEQYAEACKSGGIDVPSFTSSSSTNSGGDGFSNLKMSTAGLAGSAAALAFFLTA